MIPLTMPGSVVLPGLPAWAAGGAMLLWGFSGRARRACRPADDGGSAGSDASGARGPLPAPDWYRLVLDQVPSFVWTTDHDLVINFAAGALLPKASARALDVVGWNLADLAAGAGPDPIAAHRRALEGQPSTYDFVTYEGRAMAVHVDPLRDDSGAIIGCVAAAVDVTESRAIERELRAMKAEVEQRVRERTSELEAANARLSLEIQRHKITEAQLRWSEARYRGLIESQQDIIVRTDSNHLFTFVNDAYCRKVGKQRSELLGTPFYPFVHPDDLEPTLTRLEDLSKPPYRVRLLQRSYSVNGWRWIAWEDFAIRDEHGHIVEIQANGRDITEQIEAEASAVEQRTLAEALRDTAAALNSTLQLDEVLERILANVGRVVPHDAANVIMVDEEGMAQVARARGYDSWKLTRSVMEVRFPLKAVPGFQKMADSGEPLIVADTANDPSWVDIQGANWVRSYAGTPITIEGKLLGFLNLDCGTPDAFNATHAERLLAFADQAAIAIHNARVYEQSRELAAVEAKLEERQRIARELHDALSQTLFSASVIAQSLPRIQGSRPGETQRALEELSHLTRGAMAEMRTLLLELRPTEMVNVTLDNLLRQLTDAFSSKSGTVLTLKIRGKTTLTPEVREALYRIAQEALNNIVKHARAPHAEIQLGSTNNGTVLQIVDDGRGFDPQNIPPDHIGLDIMYERASLIGADLQVISQPGEGTEIVVTWPAGSEEGS